MNASLNFCLGQHLCLSFRGFLFSLVAIYDEHGWGQGWGVGGVSTAKTGTKLSYKFCKEL